VTDQLRFFDGQVVGQYRGTLTGFDVEDEDAQHFAADSVLVLVVAATVDGAAIKRTKDGGWLRTNQLTTGVVRVATGEMRDTLIDVFHLTDGEQLSLPMSAGGRGDPPRSTAVEPDEVPVGASLEADSSPVSAEEKWEWDDEPARVSVPADPVLRGFLNPESASQ
jgi:hypothetical protein